MDFVVAGFGLGAVMMLIGFAVRDLGPWRYRGEADDGFVRLQWIRFCRSIGNAIVSGGFIVCLVTLGLLFAGAGDAMGARTVASVSAIAVIGSGVWTVFALRKFAEATAGIPSTRGAAGALSQFGPARRASRSAAASTWNQAKVDDEDDGEGANTFDRGVPAWPVQAEPARADAYVSPKANGPTLGPSLTVPPDSLVETTAPPVPELHVAPSVAKVVAAPPMPTTPAPVVATTSAPVVATAPATRSVFESPLLADVGTESVAGDESEFRSSVFADIRKDGVRESGTWGFSSSVLADLDDVKGVEESKVIDDAEQPSPPAPLPSEGEGSVSTDVPTESVPPLPRKGEGVRR